MANTVTIKVEGLQALGLRLKKLSTEVATKAATRATSRAGSIVKKAAKNNLKSSPSIESGTLEKNVIIKKIAKSKTALTSEHIVTVKKKVYDRQGKPTNTRAVGWFVERGTVKMPAEPFLERALAHNITPAIKAMTDALEKAIAKASK